MWRVRMGYISIHVPREGHDKKGLLAVFGKAAFLSTCPVRGTTTTDATYNRRFKISIHVPREGHDHSRLTSPRRRSNFYPRAP